MNAAWGSSAAGIFQFYPTNATMPIDEFAHPPNHLCTTKCEMGRCRRADALKELGDVVLALGDDCGLFLASAIGDGWKRRKATTSILKIKQKYVSSSNRRASYS